MKVQSINKDANFFLLALNMLLVLLGYAAAYAFGEAVVGPFKFIKSAILLISILYLIKTYPRQFIGYPILRQQLVLFMVLLFLISPLLSDDIQYSMSRTLTFVVPFLYVFFCIKYLILRFGYSNTWKGFTSAVNWVYVVPLLTFLIAGASFELTDIYGKTDEAGLIFVSNHFGWSSAIFLLTSIDLLNNKLTRRYRKLLIYFFCLLSIYLLYISGSRSSLLSVAMAFVVFLFFNTQLHLFYKTAVIILIIYLGGNFLKEEESAVNKRYNLTLEQLEEGEAREMMMDAAINIFNKDQSLWIFGSGLFNYEIYGDKMLLDNYHNSYFEVLFGGGVFVFMVFLILFVYRPLRNYVAYYHKYSLIIFPIMIIPFFESNLTGGQFLFFPWFGYTLLYSFDPELVGTRRENDEDPN